MSIAQRAEFTIRANDYLEHGESDDVSDIGLVAGKGFISEEEVHEITSTLLKSNWSLQLNDGSKECS